MKDNKARGRNENTEDGQKAPVIKMNSILIPANEQLPAVDYHTKEEGCTAWKIPISF